MARKTPSRIESPRRADEPEPRTPEPGGRRARPWAPAWPASVTVAALVIFSFLGVQGLAGQDNPRPAGSTANGGIPVGVAGTAGEGLSGGAVRVDVYFDFLCPPCRDFEEVNGPVLASLRESGEVVVVYHPLAFLDKASAGSNYSTRAAQAAALVADQAPAQFLRFVRLLFVNQPRIKTPGHTDAEIAEIARVAGVPEPVLAMIPMGRFHAWVKGATEQASRDGVQKTPTVRINGKDFEGDWHREGSLEKAIRLPVRE